jgi:chromosome segregation ATPase
MASASSATCSTLSAAAPDTAESLRERLAELEAELATLRAELAAFKSDYLRIVGVIEVQVQELEARILAIVAARSGQLTDAAAADAAQERFRETTTALRAVPPPAGPAPTDDLKALYRDAAKRMHPDGLPEEAREHAEAFMTRLNQAYAASDADAIGNLVRQWESSPFARPADGGSRPSPALRAAVANAEQRLAELRDSDLARLMEQAFAASMAGRDLLVELRQDAEAALARARARLAELDG